MLRNTIFLVLACLIIGMAYFAIAHWIFGDHYQDAFSEARGVFLTCFVFELFIRPWMEKKFGDKKTKSDRLNQPE